MFSFYNDISFISTLRENFKKLPGSKACFCLNLFKISMESKPALSLMILGMHSKALAKEFMIN